jgi:hypothetical protein
MSNYSRDNVMVTILLLVFAVMALILLQDYPRPSSCNAMLGMFPPAGCDGGTP